MLNIIWDTRGYFFWLLMVSLFCSGPVSLETSADGGVLKALTDGLLLGSTSSLAAGCTVGHSLIGAPLLSVGSLVTTAFIILGSWAAGHLGGK